MPAAETHRACAAYNEEFYAKLDQTVDGGWAVTALFYSALHYVDAFLAERENAHPGDHGERDRMIKANHTTDGVRNHYRRLQDKSRDARYNGGTFTPATIRTLFNSDFEVVKRAVNR
jgi:hypothetical protein